MRAARALIPVLQPDVNLGLWERRLPVVVSRYAQRFPRIHMVETVPVTSVATWLSALPRGEGRAAFIRDVSMLCGLMGRMLGVDRVFIKLRHLDTDECRAFHVDHVGLRLITTYAGPGTELLPDDAVDRAWLGRPQGGVAAMNRRIVTDAARIHRMDVGHVAILKGEAFHGNRGRGAVHRSPPLQRQRLHRLRLVVESPDSPCAC
jgi:hypothetical protein